MNHFTSLYYMYFIPEAWYELALSPGHASIWQDGVVWIAYAWTKCNHLIVTPYAKITTHTHYLTTFWYQNYYIQISFNKIADW